MEPRPPGRQRIQPAAVVLALSGATFWATAAVPLALTAPPPGMPAVLLVLALVAVLALLTAVLWVAVSPAVPRLVAVWSAPALVAATLLLWLPLHAWAQEGQVPWAWLTGLAIAACALVALRTGVIAGVVLGLGALVGSVATGGPTVRTLLTALGCALALWLMCQVMVWLLRLLAAADGERAAQAELAVAQDRLRVSRELHDVLGHRLGVIAMKADLTADLAGRAPGAAAAEAREIRQLAAQTLAESRRAVHGEATADLTAQLASAELVLASAGIAVTADVDRDAVAGLPEHLSRLLAVVVREAVTNVLRHSDAREVRVTLSGSGTGAVLRIANNGAREPTASGAPGSGTGLASLAARCAAAGVRLVAGPGGHGRFEVRAEAPEPGREGQLGPLTPVPRASAGEDDDRYPHRTRARQFRLRSGATDRRPAGAAPGPVATGPAPGEGRR